MDIPTEILDIILSHLDRTSIFVCKFVCKSIYQRINIRYPKLTLDIYEIIYRDYYNLYVNWIVPTMGVEPQKIIYKAEYVIGLGNSYSFFESIISSDQSHDLKSCLFGAFNSVRSGKESSLSFCKWLINKAKPEDFRNYILGMAFASHSIELTDYVLTLPINSMNHDLSYLYNRHYSSINDMVGFKDNSNLCDYVKYLLTKFPEIKPQDLLMKHCDDLPTIQYLVSLGAQVGSNLFRAWCSHGNVDIVKYIDSLSIINKSYEFIVYNRQTYDFLTSKGYGINVAETVIECLVSDDSDLLSHILNTQDKQNNYLLIDMLLSLMNDGDQVSCITIVSEYGYKFPTNTYELLKGRGGDFITFDCVKLLHAFGVEWTRSSLEFVLDSGDVRVIEFALDNGLIMPENILDQPWIYELEHIIIMIEFLLDKGYKYTSLAISYTNDVEILELYDNK